MGAVGSSGEECMASMDVEEPVKVNIRPLIPQDDEDCDVPDMLDCEDSDNLVENDAVRFRMPPVRARDM